MSKQLAMEALGLLARVEKDAVFGGAGVPKSLVVLPTAITRVS